MAWLHRLSLGATVSRLKMPILANERHEKFAQLLAQGKSANESYGLAGFKPNRGNCITLKAQPKIAQRVAELQTIAANAIVKRVESQALAQHKAAEMTTDVLVNMLMRVEEQARQLDQPAAAVAAIKEIGVLTGTRVERSERGKPGDYSDRTPEQMRADLAAKLERMLGGVTIEGEVID